MSLLFYTDEKHKVILRPDCYKLSPELQILKDDEVLFIALAYDYHSPYRQFPEHERVKKAMIHAFDYYDTELVQKTSMKLAIEAYKGLQYDPKIELANRYQLKIDKLLNQLDGEDTPSAIKKIMEAVDALRANIRDLQNEYVQSLSAKGQIKGNKERSWLEEMQSNQKHYRTFLQSVK